MIKLIARSDRISTPAAPFGAILLSAIAMVAAAACSDPAATGLDAPGLRAAKGGGGPGDADPVVQSVVPDSATQNTTLDIEVGGRNFDDGSVVELGQGGTASPKIQTNSTTFLNPRKLRANITVAADADLGLYDVIVTSFRGRRGIGAELFAVKEGPPNTGGGNGTGPDGTVLPIEGVVSVSVDPTPIQVERDSKRVLEISASEDVSYTINLSKTLEGIVLAGPDATCIVAGENPTLPASDLVKRLNDPTVRAGDFKFTLDRRAGESGGKHFVMASWSEPVPEPFAETGFRLAFGAVDSGEPKPPGYVDPVVWEQEIGNGTTRYTFPDPETELGRETNGRVRIFHQGIWTDVHCNLRDRVVFEVTTPFSVP